MSDTPCNCSRNTAELLQQIFNQVGELCHLAGVDKDKWQDVWSLGEELDKIIKERNALRKQVAELINEMPRVSAATPDQPTKGTEE